MAEINLTDERGRDAVVNAESATITTDHRWIDEEEQQVGTRKILRCTMEKEESTLIEEAGGLDEFAEALIAGDPELDVESFGRFLSETSRIYVDQDHEIVHHIKHWEVIHNPDGSERERRPKEQQEPNVASETPLKWTGKLLKKTEVYKKFVFSGKMQIQHVNGLTYDFLYSMAKDLVDAESMMLLGGGSKGVEPLIFRRGGLSYRGFLEGRVEGDKYALILHLSNMELKSPKVEEDAA